MFAAIFSYGISLFPYLGALHAATVLHHNLLLNILRMSLQFFDTTPVGRILSRFSKDLESVDQALPIIIDEGIYCAFEVILCVILIRL